MKLCTPMDIQPYYGRVFGVPEGYYEKPRDLLFAMKDKVRAESPTAHERITLPMDSHSRRCKVVLKDNASFIPNKHILKMLGFKNKTTLDHTQISSEIADLNRDMHVFFVYSDLIQPVMVGHDQVPLLRTIEVPHAVAGSVITRSYTNPHYLPLRSNDIEEIEINITKGSGELVHFNGGLAIVKLHFKQMSPLL